MMTDNGPQFVTKEYQRFASEYDFSHITASPYYPRGNGKAESTVKIAKNMLRKCEDLDLAMLLQWILGIISAKPHFSTHIHRWSMRLLQRKIRIERAVWLSGNTLAGCAMVGGSNLNQCSKICKV